jgi:hypothetical protein
MQVSSLSTVPSAISTAARTPIGPTSKIDSVGGLSIRKGVDFSHITPRQLNDYVNERIFANDIAPDEADGLINMLNTNQMDDAPDVPFDLRARMQGMSDFLLDAGDALGAWYAGLVKRLDDMEAQSVRLDAFA